MNKTIILPRVPRGSDTNLTSGSAIRLERRKAPPIVESEEIRFKVQLASFNDPRMFKLYQSNQRKYLDLWAILPIIVLYHVTIVTRFNLQYDYGTDGPLFCAGFAAILFGLCVFLPYFTCRVVIHYTPINKQDSYVFKMCQQLLILLYYCRVEDFIQIIGTFALGLFLLGRVYAGQCEDVADIWSTQRCNPFADVQSIPGDQVMLLYLVPLMSQCCLGGTTVPALLFTSAVGFAFVVIASMHVGGSLQIWTLAYCGLFINVTFVIERLMRLNFLQGLAMAAAERTNMEREGSLRDLLNQNEVTMKETELFQLRSLMGNVAHDLKTPLHSIEADLEVLSVFVSNLPQSKLRAARATHQTNGSGMAFDPLSVFNSLNATCKFMAMAINRSQDFMKAGNNIALVPAMETFNLSEALAVSVTCIRHLEVERTIIVHPPDDDVTSHVISDKHWLSENVLCLLSNALKYSDEGPVDVRLKFVRVSDPPVGPSVKMDGDQRSFYQREKNTFDKSEKKGCGPHHDPADSLRRIKTFPERRRNPISCENAWKRNSCSDVPDGPMSLMLLLTVEDNGIGIAEEARKNLFQPFKQAQRMAGGTGLGLYSLSKRIEALGGECGVTDRTDGNQGSKFWFTFPYRPDESAITHSVIDASSEVGMGSVDEVRPLRILVVDDSLSIMKVTSRLLKSNGHIVETASNGSIGLKMLKVAAASQDYDMVLTDLQMPVMDGIEATARYRKFEEEIMQRERNDGSSVNRKKLLIVGMSANSDAQSKQTALNAGMDYFVCKPFSYKDLKPILLNNIA